MSENKYYKTNPIVGNPANVVVFFFDKDIPWQIRLGLFLIGCVTWGSLILALLDKHK